MFLGYQKVRLWRRNFHSRGSLSLENFPSVILHDCHQRDTNAIAAMQWARWNSSMAFADGEWGWNETEAEYKAASWGGLSNDTLDFQEGYERLVRVNNRGRS